MGDQSLRTAVEGISPPEKEKHQFFLDVQPVSSHLNCFQNYNYQNDKKNELEIKIRENFRILGNGNVIACSSSCSNQFGCQSSDRYQAGGQLPRYYLPDFVVRRRHWRFTRRNHQPDAVGHTGATKSTPNIDDGSIHRWCIAISYCRHMFGATITPTEHIAPGIKLFGHLGCWSGEEESAERTQTILDRSLTIFFFD